MIDDLVLLMRDGHIERLRLEICHVQSGLIFLEILTNLERASDQCSNIALNLLAKIMKKSEQATTNISKSCITTVAVNTEPSMSASAGDI